MNADRVGGTLSALPNICRMLNFSWRLRASRQLACAALLALSTGTWIGATPAMAATLEGQSFEETAVLSERTLRLNGLGLPTSYVSGYLRTVPPPGKERLEGADATHAWVSVWCGTEDGWLGFDPTNDILVENDHIVLAVGRDFSDVSPVDGIIVGSRKQKLAVAVDVLLVE